MKILIPIVIAIAVVWLLVVLLRSRSSRQEPTVATRDQIPSIVSKLQQTGRDGSFVVFMFSIPGNHDETLPNLQYSIENGQLGLDWVLLAPQNIQDETLVTDFVKRLGYTLSKHEINDVPYLRIEGDSLEDLGLKILRDLYQLPADTKLQLIAEGFDMGMMPNNSLNEAAYNCEGSKNAKGSNPVLSRVTDQEIHCRPCG